MYLSHVMLRVKNLQQSIAFYTDVIGLSLFKQKDFPLGKFSIAFLAVPDSNGAMIELTYNWDDRDYEHGDYFGHVAFVVEDIQDTCTKIEARGGEFYRKPGPMLSSPESKVQIAFLKDPDGHKIEFLQRS